MRVLTTSVGCVSSVAAVAAHTPETKLIAVWFQPPPPLLLLLSAPLLPAPLPLLLLLLLLLLPCQFPSVTFSCVYII
jgi:hypothetical protein